MYHIIAAADGPNAALPIIVLILGSAIAITVIVQIFGVAKARGRTVQSLEYKQLAEESSKNQEKIAEQLEVLASSSKQITQRLQEVERILKDIN